MVHKVSERVFGDDQRNDVSQRENAGDVLGFKLYGQVRQFAVTEEAAASQTLELD